MSLCFAVGIQGRKPSERQASGIHVIEHAKYGIRHEETDRVELVTDFFLPNAETDNRVFSFVHAGDIRFEALAADEVLSPRDFCTAFLEGCYSPSLGGRFERKKGHLYGLSPPDIAPVDIRGADEYRNTFLCRDCNEASGAPFTLCEVQIPGRTFGFVRVRGTIEGDTLSKLTEGKTHFDIYGGEVLLNRIKAEHIRRGAVGESGGQNEYEALFDDFVENYYVEPDRYDVVLRSYPGTRLVKTRRLSRDLFLGCEAGRLYGDQIYWYWSRSAQFYVSSYPNGLRVGVELEARGKRHRQLAGRRRL